MFHLKKREKNEQQQKQPSLIQTSVSTPNLKPKCVTLPYTSYIYTTLV